MVPSPTTEPEPGWKTNPFWGFVGAGLGLALLAAGVVVPPIALARWCLLGALVAFTVAAWIGFNQRAWRQRAIGTLLILFLTAFGVLWIGFYYRRQQPRPLESPASLPATKSTKSQQVNADPAPARASYPYIPAKGISVGKDSVALGHVPEGSKIGDGSVIVGPTDSHGNTILNQGGLAVGKGATADPTSIAIGANAHAGGQVNAPTTIGPVTVRPGAVVSIGQQGGQTAGTIINNVPPALVISNEQMVKIANALSSLSLKHNDQEINIIVHDATTETAMFGNQLATAFILARMRSPKIGHVLYIGELDRGVTIRSGTDNADIAGTLADVLVKCGAIGAHDLHSLGSTDAKDFQVLIKR